MHGAAQEIRNRLGRYRWGSSREIKALGRRVGRSPIVATGGAARGARGWVVAATDTDVFLARRPWLFGRARDDHFAWADLTAVEASTMRMDLAFGERTLQIALLPTREHARLLDAAYRRLGADPGASVESLRQQLRDELGRLGSVEFGQLVEQVPGRLEPGESVDFIARATLDFEGLLIVTDRRLLLLESKLRNPREWSCERSEIRWVTAVDGGVRLDVGGERHTLVAISPPHAEQALLDELS